MFCASYGSEMKEASTGIINLDEEQFVRHTILDLLYFLYGNVLPEGFEDLVHLYQLAHLWQFDELMLACEYAIIEHKDFESARDEMEEMLDIYPLPLVSRKMRTK